MTGQEPAIVGVSPPVELKRRRRLFECLGRAASVRFEGREASAWSGCDAAVLFGSLTPRAEALPPQALVVPNGPPSSPSPAAPVELSPSDTVDVALRGRRLLDDRVGSLPPLDMEGEKVLASAFGVPIWTRKLRLGGELDRSAAPLAELREGERLREVLRAGSFVSLLPLVDLVRRVSGWQQAPLRATFVFDDPNLHWHSYGYIRFRDLAAHAREHGYCVTFGLIPLDAWVINPEVAALFRRSTPTLSLAVHGNDHVKQELGRCTSEDASRRLLAQALHRITRFEQRSGLSVARVMIAPHGICSRPAMRALADCGFDAACFWMGPDDAADPTLAGWEPADATEEGLPVISRHPLTGSSDDLVFQAYLRKPLVLYGHHQDLEGGLERLSEAAMSLSRLGDVRWCPLGEIAATNAAQGLSGAVLRLRLFSRLVAIRVPDGVEKVVVEPTALTGGDTVILSDKEGREAARGAPGTQLSVGAREVEIRL